MGIARIVPLYGCGFARVAEMPHRAFMHTRPKCAIALRNRDTARIVPVNFFNPACVAFGDIRGPTGVFGRHAACWTAGMQRAPRVRWAQDARAYGLLVLERTPVVRARVNIRHA